MYCERADIISSIGRDDLINYVNDENRTGDQIDFDSAADSCSIIVDKMISDSMDEIDPFLQPLNVLPLSEVPKIIKIICIRIAIKNLYERRLRDDMPDSVTSDYKIQLDKLEKIRVKKLKLGNEVVSTDGSTPSTMHVNKTSSDQVFNSDLMTRF